MEILSEIFGEYYQAKIMEILLENYSEEFTIKDILQMAETSRGSTYKYIKELAKKEILIETRKIGKNQLYKINKENLIVKALVIFEHVIVTSNIEEEIKKKEEGLTRELSIELDHEKLYSYNINKYVENEKIVSKDNDEKPIVTYEYKAGDVNKWKKLVTV